MPGPGWWRRQTPSRPSRTSVRPRAQVDDVLAQLVPAVLQPPLDGIGRVVEDALDPGADRGTLPDFSGLTTARVIWSLTAFDASRCSIVSSNGSATLAADSGSAARIFGSASSASTVA